MRSFTSALVDLTETHKKSLEIQRLLEAERSARTASEAKDQRNAIKFTPDNGRIELRSWNREGRLAVEVSDTGSGFDEDAGPRLFRAFEQDTDVPQRFGGLGLGLAICKGVMELHGGTIAATSLGRHLGSRFVIELGTMPAPPLVVAASAREANPSPFRMAEASPALTIQRNPPEAPPRRSRGLRPRLNPDLKPRVSDGSRRALPNPGRDSRRWRT